MGYSGQIFHFNAYSTRIPHAAGLGRKNGAKTHGLILKIHNKKTSVLRENYRKTKKDGISLRIFRGGPSVEIRTQGRVRRFAALRPQAVLFKWQEALRSQYEEQKRSASSLGNTSFGPSVEIRTQGRVRRFAALRPQAVLFKCKRP